MHKRDIFYAAFSMYKAIKATENTKAFPKIILKPKTLATLEFTELTLKNNVFNKSVTETEIKSVTVDQKCCITT